MKSSTSRSLWLIFLTCILYSLFKNILGGNEQDVLVYAKQFMNPEWLPSDWYLNLEPGYRLIFNVLAGTLARFFSLPAVSVIGRLIIYALYSLVLSEFCKDFKIPSLFAVLLTYLILSNGQTITAKEWMIGGFDTKSFSYIAVLASLLMLNRKQYRNMFLLAGAGLSFHILVGGYGLLALFFTYIFNLQDFKNEQKQILYSAPLFFLTAWAGLYGIFSHMFFPGGVDSFHAGLIYVQNRVPHHTLPSSWKNNQWILKILAAFLIYLCIALYSKKSSFRLFSAFALGSLVPFTVGIILFLTGRFHLLKYYWFRFADTILPFFAFIFFISYLSVLYRKALKGTLIRKISSIILILLSTGLLAYSAFSSAEDIRGMLVQKAGWYIRSMDAPQQEVTAFIRDNTPEEACFLVPPSMEYFYIAAERAIFVSFKHSPQSEADILKWDHRLMLCNKRKKIPSGGFSSINSILGNYYSLQKTDLLSIREQYDCDYYMALRAQSLPFKTVFSNTSYRLYDLNKELK